ncbi:penicillin-binding protein 2 [Panacagrimonas perspica]|uniref:Peptidoglycan D,D-transpeptidase MrdA n=1 Tax=Panacagrimonas perspica TaxID=381431 RepID=A0A4R7P0N3_9GAMM|nr:penicillin-binding protein 2 [Panacagrimonas perspica]TDU26822.1 penicillin-binding protein 2 [Panacagrimonas perspica]THD03599.1 penicillin-binding protein 2 [Panacagrimonas perspica]
MDNLKNLVREKHMYMTRIGVAVLVCLSMTSLLVYRLIGLQVIDREYYATRAEENRMRLSAVPPVRGLVTDRNGVLLAQNTPAFVLEVVPEQVENMDTLLRALRPVLNLDDVEIARFKDRVGKTPRYRSVPLRGNLTMEQVARFQLNRFDFEGADVTATLTRSYPLGSAAAHVVGYVGGITEEEFKKIEAAAYQGLTQIGKIGVEKSHENELRGTPGAKIVEANAYGRPLRELEYRQGAPGKNLVLSLDAKVQMAAEKALAGLDGAVVAIDPRNGEVIALVSKPGFDPQPFVAGIDRTTYKALLDDRKRPLYNRALQGAYPPGSTVKPFMALAGLEYETLQGGHGEYCSGSMSLPHSTRKYRCWKRSGHGWLDMAGGVIQSCDIYFYEVAQALGIDRIHTFLSLFGLGHPTDVDLPLEKSGLLPSREWKMRTRKEAWFPGETLNIGIGQGYMTTTPMQLAQITARMAMRGKGFKPHVVHAMQDTLTGATTLVPPEALPAIPHRHAQDWETVINAMVEVTASQRGTAYRVFKDAPYRVAAKTGTAQVAGMSQDELRARKLTETPFHLRDHALFIAFAPAEDPKIAVAVIAEHAGHGGSAAAPVARQVMDQYLLGQILYNLPADPGAGAPVAAGVPAAPVELIGSPGSASDDEE